MQICVISGSPKGDASVTLQYVRFIEQAFPEHTFSVVHAGREITSIEQNKDEWSKTIAKIRDSDGIFIATPVYYMLIPAQLKRFIELAEERHAEDAFFGKYAVSLTTSMHFFDHTAHNYLHGVCEDIGMRYVGFYSAHMQDLQSEECQKQLLLFFSDYLEAIAEKRPIQRAYLPLLPVAPSYSPKSPSCGVDTDGKKVVILHDAEPGSDQEAMVNRMAGCFVGDVTVADIRDSRMTGGCLGCCQCAFDNTCVYHDGFKEFWEKYVVLSDILIMAGTIRDRYLSATWKQWNDRSFFNGHVPTWEGKQVAYLVEGPLAHIPNLREVLAARAMMGRANLVGIVTNESRDPVQIDAALTSLAKRTIKFSILGYIPSFTFPAIAGRKLFRDEIWEHLRAVFKADDRYYRTHGYYDFPTKNYLQRMKTRAFSLFLGIPYIRKKVKKEMINQMVRPFREARQKSRILAERKAGKG